MRPLKALFTFFLCSVWMPVLSETAHKAVSCAQRGGSLQATKKTSQMALKSTWLVRGTTPHETSANTSALRHLSTRNLTPNCLLKSLD